MPPRRRPRLTDDDDITGAPVTPLRVFKQPDPVEIPEDSTCWQVVLPMALPVVRGLFLSPDHPDYNPEAAEPFTKRSVRTMVALQIMAMATPATIAAARYKLNPIKDGEEPGDDAAPSSREEWGRQRDEIDGD